MWEERGPDGPVSAWVGPARCAREFGQRAGKSSGWRFHPDPCGAGGMSRSMERNFTGAALGGTLAARALDPVKRYSWREAAEATLAVCASLGSK
jgi:hypothetical protein